MRVSSACMRGVLVATFCLFAQAQNTTTSANAQVNEKKGLPPRAAPTDYQAHAQAGTVIIGAEFLGHSIPRPEGPLSTEDYVAVETGLFGPSGEHLKLSIDDFSLRLNGKKTPLSSQPFVVVVSSLKDPSWQPPEKAEAKSKGGLSTGGGDSNEPPPPVHVPFELQRAMAQYVQRASLPEGDRPLPQAGLIFFQYRGKTNHLRSIELTYSGPAGKAKLDLQP